MCHIFSLTLYEKYLIMKKVLFILLLLPCIGFGQIVEVKDQSIKIGKLQDIECLKDGSNYLFVYSNYEYKTITDIKSFSVSENDFETLYTKLNEAFDMPGKEPMQLDLPGYTLMISKIKFAGVTGIVIYSREKSSPITSFTQTITKKQLTKLFGKS
jgi:hypothetical protein